VFTLGFFIVILADDPFGSKTMTTELNKKDE
jgi:hypothetical protein